MKLHLVSLGCPKNLVDAELLLGRAALEGWQVTPEPREADLVVVNTCGFLEEARREARGTIARFVRLKRARPRLVVVAAGCMVEHAGGGRGKLPDGVDAAIGVGQIGALAALLRRMAGTATAGVRGAAATGRRILFPDGAHPRLVTGAGHSTYVKIGEGCSRRCSFCLIPGIRGRGVSRPPGAVAREVESLASMGVREVVLVAQDTAAYGRERRGGRAGGSPIAALVRRLGRVDGVAWLRVMYLYPEPGLPALFEAIARTPAAVPYVDMPMQHASDRMLAIMRRGHSRRLLEGLVRAARETIPGVAIRTTFLVGHPGERAADVEELRRFILAQRLDRVGIMRYSDEEGTAARGMRGKVPAAEIDRRCMAVVDAASRVLRERQRALAGARAAVMLDGPAGGGGAAAGAWRGRLPTQAPDVDGKVLVQGVRRGARPGDIVAVRIERARGPDLFARCP